MINSTMSLSSIASNAIDDINGEENIFIQSTSNALENSVPAVPTTPGIIRLQEFGNYSPSRVWKSFAFKSLERS